MRPGKTGSRVKTGDAVRWFANHVTQGTGDVPTLILGPIVWTTQPGRDGRDWYFTVASIDTAKEIRIDQFKIGMDDLPLAEKCRALLMLELIQRRPCVIHDCDDELEMAKWCAALCPCERTRSLLANVEAERRT